MHASKEQIKAINAILARLGQMEDKPFIIQTTTNNRTTHSSELTFDEARVLLTALNQRPKPADPRKKMQAAIFKIAHNMGWIKEVAVVDKTGLVKKKDYTILQQWIAKYGYLHKPLNSYSYSELPKLLSQLEAAYKHYLSKI